MGVHLVSEAQRLAYADRNKYVADTDFVPLPGAAACPACSTRTTCASRANLISFDRSMGVALPGDFPGGAALGTSAQEGKGTSHVSIVDAQGQCGVDDDHHRKRHGVVPLRARFSAQQRADRLLRRAVRRRGPIANRVAARSSARAARWRRPWCFKRNTDGSLGDLLMATGSPGGANIIQYVTKTVIGVLDWGLDAQQATALTNFGSSNSATTGIGGEHPNIDAASSGAGDALVTGLRALGHTVSVAAQSSGVSTILRIKVDGQDRLQGGADPRREGLVLGDGGK